MPRHGIREPIDMASIGNLPLKYRLFLRSYRFRRITPLPWTTASKELSSSRVALVTTAAFHLPEQAPFDETLRGGDPSYRVLPVGDENARSRLEELRISHRSQAFSHAGIEADFNLALPVDRLHELVRAGEVGDLHDEALSFTGSLTVTGRLRRTFAPEAADRLARAGVDVAFCTPV